MNRFIRYNLCLGTKVVHSSKLVFRYPNPALRSRRIGGVDRGYSTKRLSRNHSRRDVINPDTARTTFSHLRNSLLRANEDGFPENLTSEEAKARGLPTTLQRSAPSILRFSSDNVLNMARFMSCRSDISSGSVILFHSTSARMAAPFFLAPILVFLKSGTVLKTITIVSRVAVSLVAPLRLGAHRILIWWHGHEYLTVLRAKILASSGAGSKNGSHHWHPPHFHRTTIVLLATPVVILAVAVLASLERTPVWGRWRVIMMSTDEEALLIDEFLAPGTPDASSPVVRDWLAILRAASGDDDDSGPPGTLNGWRVLDPASDWRARWVQDVFLRLEAGVDRANLTTECKEDKVFSIGGQEFRLPPSEYPLSIRPAMLKHHSEDELEKGPLVTRYGCLVIEGPMRNAFSLGFGPALGSDASRYQEAPGVVVVFTGLLDEILSVPDPDYRPPEKAAITSAFGIFQRPRESSATVGVTKYHTDQLAVVLSHELGHLLLSHSLEAWATNSMYELLGTLSTDLARIILYPLTAFLGPVFNDWFGEQVKVNSALGLSLKNNCEQRKAEHEADLLGLRVLLGAGIDPRVACDVWGEKGVMQRAAQAEAALAGRGAAPDSKANEEADGWLARNGFTRTHPVNEDRLVKIKDELAQWEKR